MANDTISQVHIGESNYDICDVKSREDVKDLQIYIDEEMYSASEVDDLLSTKVDEADFVNESTGKEDGVEIVLPQGTPTSPIVLSEINDSEEMKHSTVHTSSNHYINTKLDALTNSLAGKLSIQFIDELPSNPERNTQYYMRTETPGIWAIYISDNTGTMRAAGTTELDMGGYVHNTTKVAGVELSADVSAQQIEDATKSISSVFTNKTIDANDNTISNINTTNMASSAIATSIGETPVDTKLTTEKCLFDYAVPKTDSANQIYGSSNNYALSTSISASSTNIQIPTAKTIYDYTIPKSEEANKIYGTSNNYPLVTSIGSDSTDIQIATAKSIYDYVVPKTNTANQIYGSSNNYALTTAVGNSSTDTQVPTAKSIYSYAVPKTSEANKLYGTNSSGAVSNYDRATTISTTPSDIQIPTAKAVSSYAVPKTTGTNKIYGTNSSGANYNYTLTHSYTSNGTSNIVSQKALYDAYNDLITRLKTCSKLVGIFNRTTALSTTGAAWKNINLTGSNDTNSNYCDLNNNGIMIRKAGIYKFTVTVRLADQEGTIDWSVGMTGHDDDLNGGIWMNSSTRHKLNAVFVEYYGANTRVFPRILVTNIFPNLTGCNVVVECMKES